jgi:ribose transport system permease protein
MSTVSESPPPARASKARRLPQRRQGWLLLGAERFGLLALFALVVIGFSITQNETFATADNWRTIFQSQSVIAVIAFAVIVPLIAGNFDLSVGSNTVMCSIGAAAVMGKHGWSLAPAILFAMALGTVVGIVNGFLVARLRLNGFIATLGTATVIAGLIDAYSNGLPIVEGISEKLTNTGAETALGVPKLTWIVAVIAIVVYYVLAQTPFGRRLTAIGSNPEAARLVGVRVDRLVFTSYVLAGTLAGIAGVLLVANQGSGDPSTTGFALVLPALAAVFLGASGFTPGQYNVLGTVVGLLLVAAVVSGLVLSGAEPWVESVFNGTALVLAVGASAAFRRRRLGA